MPYFPFFYFFGRLHACVVACKPATKTPAKFWPHHIGNASKKNGACKPAPSKKTPAAASPPSPYSLIDLRLI